MSWRTDIDAGDSSMKDQLYLLRPGFMNASLGPLYCNDSAPVEGMLSFFPQLRELLDVQYVEFARPRDTPCGAGSAVRPPLRAVPRGPGSCARRQSTVLARAATDPGSRSRADGT